MSTVSSDESPDESPEQTSTNYIKMKENKVYREIRP